MQLFKKQIKINQNPYTFTLLLALLTLLAAPLAAQEAQPRVVEVTLQSPHVGPQRVVYILPPGYDQADAPWPALIAFAGKGEAVRGNRAGAWGWVEVYGLLPALQALHERRVERAAFAAPGAAAWAEAYDDALQAAPYRGLVVICPYPTPRAAERERYERFILDEVIPASQERFNLRRDPAGWGVDGISLGGALALSLGFGHPERFGAIGAQQAAIGEGRLLGLLDRGGAAAPLAGRRINLLTSAHDPFRANVHALADGLRKRGVAPRLLTVPGHHDKVFVRSFGAVELLLFHDRALRGEDGPLPQPPSPPR